MLEVKNVFNKHVDTYLMWCVCYVFGKTVIRYVFNHTQKIRKPNNSTIDKKDTCKNKIKLIR
jgi:hypothetical protein